MTWGSLAVPLGGGADTLGWAAWGLGTAAEDAGGPGGCTEPLQASELQTFPLPY